MTVTSTLEYLKAMHLSAMSEELKKQTEAPAAFMQLGFEDCSVCCAVFKRFPGRVVICFKRKKEERPLHGITLPANPVSGAQVALLRFPILRYG